MTYTDAVGFLQKYAQCPRCNSGSVGKGRGTLGIDTDRGVFKRTCACGWGVFITEADQGERV